MARAARDWGSVSAACRARVLQDQERREQAMTKENLLLKQQLKKYVAEAQQVCCTWWRAHFPLPSVSSAARVAGFAGMV